MSFGEFRNERTNQGHLIVIPYNGDPAVQLFLPDPKEAERSKVAVFWKGWLTPTTAADWVNTAFSMVNGNPRCVSEVWSSQEPRPVTYDKTDINRISSNLENVASEATVTLLVQTKDPDDDRFYVWGDLRKQATPAGKSAELPNGGVSEVGIRMTSAEFVEITGKAVISSLLKRSSNIDLKEGEVEDLLQQLESKIFHQP
jgi:hypothetical protein